MSWPVPIPTTSTLLVAWLTMFLAGLPIEGLRCYFKATTSTFQTIINCDTVQESNQTAFCLSQDYGDGKVSLGCGITDKLQAVNRPNCSFQAAGFINATSGSSYNYTCCSSPAIHHHSCNGIAREAAPAPTPQQEEDVKTLCGEYSKSEILRPGQELFDRVCVNNGFSSLLAGSGPGACFGAAPVVPNSDWTFGLVAPASRNFLFEDTSSPACYTVAGFVQGGFCGERGATSKYNDPKLGKPFNGKYQHRMCAGSISEALALGNTFSLGAQDLTYEKCLDMLLTSTLSSDCISIRGLFNISSTVSRRRALLPDCCVAFYHTEPNVRAQCKCLSERLSQECASICCCQNALDEKLPEERCSSLQQFMWIDVWLEKMVREQCCATRLFDQCNGAGDCRDAGADGGMVKGLSALPMCCSYCEAFYNRMCSYQGFAAGSTVFVSMTSPTYLPFLRDLCIKKGCRNALPCNFKMSAATCTQPHVASRVLVLLSVCITSLLVLFRA